MAEKKRRNFKNQGQIWNAARRKVAGNLKRYRSLTASEKKRGNVKNQVKIWNAARRNQMAGNLKRFPSLTASIQDRYRSMTGTSSRMLWPRFVFHWPLRLFRLQSQQWDRLHNNKTAPRQQTRCTPVRSSQYTHSVAQRIDWFKVELLEQRSHRNPHRGWSLGYNDFDLSLRKSRVLTHRWMQNWILSHFFIKYIFQFFEPSVEELAKNFTQ